MAIAVLSVNPSHANVAMRRETAIGDVIQNSIRVRKPLPSACEDCNEEIVL